MRLEIDRKTYLEAMELLGDLAVLYTDRAIEALDLDEDRGIAQAYQHKRARVLQVIHDMKAAPGVTGPVG